MLFQEKFKPKETNQMFLSSRIGLGKTLETNLQSI